MAQVLVRNIEEETLRALKERARQKRTSLQQELKAILEAASRQTLSNAADTARRIQRNLKKRGIVFSDSGELQSEDRSR